MLGMVKAGVPIGHRQGRHVVVFPASSYKYRCSKRLANPIPVQRERDLYSPLSGFFDFGNNFEVRPFHLGKLRATPPHVTSLRCFFCPNTLAVLLWLPGLGLVQRTTKRTPRFWGPLTNKQEPKTPKRTMVKLPDWWG